MAEQGVTFGGRQWSGGGCMAESIRVLFDSFSHRNQKNIVKSVSPSVFDKLTDDLLIEILIRPANLCKCVSPRFRSLISGSYFVSSYVKHHQDDRSFGLHCQPKHGIYNSLMGTNIESGFPVFESPGHSLSFPDCSKRFKQKTLQCLASNNGLFLCCAVQYCRTRYFVCNMLTKQWIVLPKPPGYVEIDYVGFLCDPQYSCNDDSEMGNKTRFKVVYLEVVSKRKLKLGIYCSVSGRWTKDYSNSRFIPDCELFYGSNGRCRSAVVCNGLFHWSRLSNCGIFTYNPRNGECRTIKLPHVIRNLVHWDFDHCLGECCGRLRFSNSFHDDKSFQVWELKDYGNGGEWLLLHKVGIDEAKSTVHMIFNMSMLFPHPLKEDVVFFWCSPLSQIMEYNMTNRLLELPGFFQQDETKKIWGSVIIPFVLPCWPTAIPPIRRHHLNS